MTKQEKRIELQAAETLRKLQVRLFVELKAFDDLTAQIALVESALDGVSAGVDLDTEKIGNAVKMEQQQTASLQQMLMGVWNAGEKFRGLILERRDLRAEQNGEPEEVEVEVV